MKYIIIGLGSFGASLAVKLSQQGNEVIGVDKRMNKIDSLKDKITHAICMDCIDAHTVRGLPVKDTDVVVVAIGEDEGASILVTALMLQMKARRIISRAVSALHVTVLEAMKITEIINPEEETADRLAKRLNIDGVIDSFVLTGEYNIIEANVPTRYVGKTLEEVAFRKNYNVVVLTTIKICEEKNLLGVVHRVPQVQGVASSKTVLEEDDILVMYGNLKDIKRLLEH